MALSEELRSRARESRRRLEVMTPEENLQAAALLRDSIPHLGSERQRELAEEMAREFEERAAAQAPGSSSG